MGHILSISTKKFHLDMKTLKKLTMTEHGNEAETKLDLKRVQSSKIRKDMKRL